jgi:hypothetical protein
MTFKPCVPRPSKEQKVQIKNMIHEQKAKDKAKREAMRPVQCKGRSTHARGIQSAVLDLRGGGDKKPTAAQLRAERKEEAFAGLASWIHAGRTQRTTIARIG